MHWELQVEKEWNERTINGSDKDKYIQCASTRF